VRFHAGDAAPIDADLAVVRLVDAGDQAEERRLAGAVRADHAHDLALVDGEIEPRHDFEAAKGERDIAQLEERVGHQMISTRRSPKRPLGRTIMSTISITPSTM
jgi:hypothetical protein